MSSEVVVGLFTLGGALGGAAVGGSIVLVSGIFTRRDARAVREAEEQASWRAEGAKVLGPVLSLLRDAEPTRIGVHAGETSRRLMEQLWQRWEGMRDGIEVYAASHPAEEIGRLAGQLVIAVFNSLTSAQWLAVGETSQAHLEAAKSDYGQARDIANELLAVVRGQSAGSA